MSASTFMELLQLAEAGGMSSQSISRKECLPATRDYAAQCREIIRQRHTEGESGSNVVHQLSELADTIVTGTFQFGLCSLPHAKSLSARRSVLSRIALCALGGYGRGELAPYSDIDVCLLYEGEFDDNVKALNSHLIPFLWDLGFVVGYSLHSVEESVALANSDLNAMTSLLQGRLLAGDSTVFARMKLSMRELLSRELARTLIRQKIHERYDGLSAEHRDLYCPEPDIKENAGGLRDLHTAVWLLMATHDVAGLDEAAAQGLIAPEEHLEFVSALDFLWRIRNELHFHAGTAQDRLTYENQKHVAHVFGYGPPSQEHVSSLMQDYYVAAGKMRHFLDITARICNYAPPLHESLPTDTSRSKIFIENGLLYAGLGDEKWFIHTPSRLMEVFWKCARNMAVLSRPTERLIANSLDLVGDTFRSNDIVRRLFVAICNHPLQAGHALRQAAHVGFLGRYLPEFAAFQGIIRYADFHHYPVDEHTLRAIEALNRLPEIEGPVGRCLREALENLSDPYILVMAILFHDLGKAEGDVHVQESVRLTRRIGERIGLPEEDTERIAVLVQHHMLMTEISQYRDVDDDDIVTQFADTMKTEQRLRAQFLISYADLFAVGPNVWNDWKGALLLQLYLRCVKRLLGRVETAGDEYWTSQKAREVRDALGPLGSLTEPHLRGLGQRYFLAFKPEQIVQHINSIEEARESGLTVYCTTNRDTAMSEVVIVTNDRLGLFSQIAGSFSSQLIDVNSAALFTRPDGYVVDCFTVFDAHRRRPLTTRQFHAFEQALRGVLLEGKDVHEYVEQSRRRLFALLQPKTPMPTRIQFDNESSRRHTVIDIETGDRTGLLYDITRAMTESGLDISTARIATDARRVRDSFYVTQDSNKIENEEVLAAIREHIRLAIHPVAATT